MNILEFIKWLENDSPSSLAISLGRPSSTFKSSTMDMNKDSKQEIWLQYAGLFETWTLIAIGKEK